MEEAACRVLAYCLLVSCVRRFRVFFSAPLSGNGRLRPSGPQVQPLRTQRRGAFLDVFLRSRRMNDLSRIGGSLSP